MVVVDNFAKKIAGSLVGYAVFYFLHFLRSIDKKTSKQENNSFLIVDKCLIVLGRMQSSKV